MDRFITCPSSSKQVPVNINPQIDKSDDESDSEATATVSKRKNCSENARHTKSKKYEDSRGMPRKQRHSPTTMCALLSSAVQRVYETIQGNKTSSYET